MSAEISPRRFTLSLLKKEQGLLCGLFLIAAIWAIDLSLRPYILKIVIDRVQLANHGNGVEPLYGPLILYSVISVLIILMFRLRDYIHITLNANIKTITSDVLMNRMLQHSLLVFQNNFAGNLATKIKEVMSGIPDAIKYIDELVAIFLCLIIASFTLWTINYQFALLLIMWLGIFIGITLIATKKGKQLCMTTAELNSLLVGQMVDILSNIISIKLFASRKYELTNLETAVQIKVTADKKRDWYFLKTFLLLGLSFILYQTFGFVLLIYWFKAGVVTAGDFALLVSINIAIVTQLWSLSGIFLNLSEVVSNVIQGLKIALQPIDILDKPNASALQVTTGAIEFEQVTFSYSAVAPIFSDKNITIPGGQKIGLVGYSGGGKTTFVNLILRLYDINHGSIKIDKQNIQYVTQDSLHENISFIPQDPFLFHRTLLDNIRYGKHTATDAEVIAAAKKANAHDFIMQLPNGYSSLVGERGIKLSGGQRQRIAIARAILKNAPILILDEATSQLDSITEQEIQASLLQLMQNKTTIVIAHRLSTLLHMDRILVFSHGKIIEDGTHGDLLSANGLYKNLWDAQIGGFLLDDLE